MSVYAVKTTRSLITDPPQSVENEPLPSNSGNVTYSLTIQGNSNTPESFPPDILAVAFPVFLIPQTFKQPIKKSNYLS